MPFSDMLFATTHSVEELVDIKQQKKVDKVLLKVIRTVRTKGNLSGWVKPESNFKTDLKLSDKVINSIKKALGEYYGLNLMENSSLNSAKALTTYIKVNKPNVADSIYLINVDENEIDVNDEVQMDSEMVDPNISKPTEEEVAAPVVPRDPAIPDAPEPHQVVPVMQEPVDNLQPVPEEVEGSDVGEDPVGTEEAEQSEVVEPSTEAYANPQLNGKFVWTYYTRSKEGIKDKMITVGAGPNSRYICQVFSTKEALIANQTKGAYAPHTVPYALGIPFNYIKKYLGKREKLAVINQQVKVPVAICVIDKIPMERYKRLESAKEGLDVSTEGLSINPTKTKSWADVMNNL